MILTLIFAGALFALAYLVHALIRAARKHERVTMLDLALVFLAALVSLTGLIMNNLDRVGVGQMERLVIGIALTLIAGSIIVMLLELRRPARLSQSRGVLGLGAGVMLFVMVLVTPVIGANFLISSQLSDIDDTVQPVTEMTQSPQERALDVFDQVIRVIARQTGLDMLTIAENLDAGTTVAQLVREHNGNLEVVVNGIADIMSQQVQLLAAEGQIEPAQAAIGISYMETIVRRGVESDLTGFLARFSEFDELEEEDIRARLANDDDDDATRLNGAATSTLIPTQTTTPTESPAETPTATREPPQIATLMPLPTRESFATTTPTSTPTLASPCLVVTRFNVNLRAAPDLDAELLATIDFDTTLNAHGRDAAGEWWFVEYEDMTGWLSAEFVNATPPCADLPVRR